MIQVLLLMLVNLILYLLTVYYLVRHPSNNMIVASMVDKRIVQIFLLVIDWHFFRHTAQTVMVRKSNHEIWYPDIYPTNCFSHFSRQNARELTPAGGEGSESGLVSKEAREQLVGRKHFVFLLNQKTTSYSSKVLYTKLFLILGILWMFSTIHYILHSNHPDGFCHYSNNLEVFFRVIDSLNLLRGFFMFVIFVCKENVKKKVGAMFGLRRCEHNGSVKTLHETTEMTEMAVA